MAYREKTKSPVVEKAESRLNGMQVVDGKQEAPVNYGNSKTPLTVAEMTAQIALVESKRGDYNRALKAADELSNDIDAEEKKLSEMSTKVLSGAVSEFGEDSDEYEQLGGTKKSDRKKPVRKPKA
ncbi:MAG: hypothetical protein M0Q21_01035 [Ignavibacteriaceae bacterium]|nr:hypothetical protein [Ignavibacteriaceae bacterium]